MSTLLCYNEANMDNQHKRGYPLHIARALEAADSACRAGGDGSGGESCHDAVLRLADSILYYLGAVAVAQYSQASLLEQSKPDPTLSRSLRSLRRVLPGQWLLWTARSLDATPEGPLSMLGGWYNGEHDAEIAQAYETIRQAMVEHLGYTGEYGSREQVSPRLLLEMVNQYRIRLSKAPANVTSGETQAAVSAALNAGLQAILSSSPIFTEYSLYAPQQRKLLVGSKAVTPMPPLTVPADAEAATILLYPPGEMPDYTKRPNLQTERQPLFPLDPLLIYTLCPQCGQERVAALQGVANGTPGHLGLDPDCGHILRVGD